MAKRVSFTTKDGKKVSFTPKNKKKGGGTNKKPRTAKQKAATRALVALNKGNSKPTKTSNKRKASKGSQMAAKKQSRKSKAKGILNKIASKSTVDKVLKGAGAASLATAALTVLSPQNANNPIVRIGAGFVADQSIEGIVGAVLSNPQTVNMLKNVVIQGVGQMGGGNGMGMQMQGGNGFA